MPIYEYKCLKCASHVEKMQKVADKPLKKCEECGGKLEKQWSLSGFQFKGAGWYVTDYAKNKTETDTEKPEKTEKTEKSEKSSTTESTAKGESASKQTKDDSKSSVKSKDSKKE